MDEEKKTFSKDLFLFAVGGTLYVLIEYWFRSRSHWTMFLLGGICFLYAGFRSRCRAPEEVFWKTVIKVWFFVLAAEFQTGCIVNVILDWNVWDYSKLPGNVLGQTCWQFALLFLPLCAAAILLNDSIQWLLFHEKKPHYHWKRKGAD